ncbi:hypothetical protein T492DRAFT_1114812 [Pavlovales sp. CCMP2436]|nr:hypothetical protein T492DRAFT_1114812 [Pavlovales sp. CCMP2436]
MPHAGDSSLVEDRADLAVTQARASATAAAELAAITAALSAAPAPEEDAAATQPEQVVAAIAAAPSAAPAPEEGASATKALAESAALDASAARPTAALACAPTAIKPDSALFVTAATPTAPAWSATETNEREPMALDAAAAAESPQIAAVSSAAAAEETPETAVEQTEQVAVVDAEKAVVAYKAPVRRPPGRPPVGKIWDSCVGAYCDDLSCPSADFWADARKLEYMDESECDTLALEKVVVAYEAPVRRPPSRGLVGKTWDSRLGAYRDTSAASPAAPRKRHASGEAADFDGCGACAVAFHTPVAQSAPKSKGKAPLPSASVLRARWMQLPPRSAARTAADSVRMRALRYNSRTAEKAKATLLADIAADTAIYWRDGDGSVSVFDVADGRLYLTTCDMCARTLQPTEGWIQVSPVAAARSAASCVHWPQPSLTCLTCDGFDICEQCLAVATGSSGAHATHALLHHDAVATGDPSKLAVKWSDSLDTALLDAVANEGLNWDFVGAYLNVPASSCAMRFYALAEQRGTCPWISPLALLPTPWMGWPGRYMGVTFGAQEKAGASCLPALAPLTSGEFKDILALGWENAAEERAFLSLVICEGTRSPQWEAIMRTVDRCRHATTTIAAKPKPMALPRVAKRGAGKPKLKPKPKSKAPSHKWGAAKPKSKSKSKSKAPSHKRGAAKPKSKSKAPHGSLKQRRT